MTILATGGSGVREPVGQSESESMVGRSFRSANQFKLVDSSTLELNVLLAAHRR
jgi:hypothetical protein